MDALGGLLIGTMLTIVVVVLLLVVSKGVKKRLFPGENVNDRAEAMTELLLFQARLQEEATEGTETTGGEQAGRPRPENRAPEDGPGGEP